MDDTTAWDHIATAEDRIKCAPDIAAAYALLSIARSLADMNEREGVRFAREDWAMP